MYFKYEMPDLVSDSCDIEELYCDQQRGSLQIYVYPNRWFLNLADLKVIIHSSVEGTYRPRYNKHENILMFATASKMRDYLRRWTVPLDFLNQFMVKVIEKTTVEVTVYPVPTTVAITPTIEKNKPLPWLTRITAVKKIGVETKTNLAL